MDWNTKSLGQGRQYLCCVAKLSILKWNQSVWENHLQSTLFNMWIYIVGQRLKLEEATFSNWQVWILATVYSVGVYCLDGTWSHKSLLRPYINQACTLWMQENPTKNAKKIPHTQKNWPAIGKILQTKIHFSTIFSLGKTVDSLSYGIFGQLEKHE